ncbi:MAG TPA: Lrp/AsnC family transcriptional regulator [Burkholderiaceae bacterium]|nr:Lrp/AsnC family transcriptional regulator [Burkholderiaceae bacterium]
MESTALDALDGKIIAALRRDGRVSNLELATQVGLSPSQCLRRVRRLEDAGVIRGYTALIDDACLGYDIAAWVVITIRKGTVGSRERVMHLLQSHSAVVTCHGITGDVDFLTQVRARNMAAFTRFLVDELNGHPDILSTQSYICLDTVKSPAGTA